jgi:hypothetical protein
MADHLEVPEADEDVGVDTQVPWRVFGAVGAFVALLCVLYGATSGEEAGSALLAVAGLLGLWCGAFLWRDAARHRAGSGTGLGSDGTGADPAATYLPDASVWPLGIGLGATLVLNGLLIGTWFLVPGVMVLAVSLAGFARQSRHRS